MNQLLPYNHNLKNILEFDGEAYYLSDVFTVEQCINIYTLLLTECNWQNDVVIMFGKTITTRRKTAWHGEPEMDYTYSGIKRKPYPFTPILHELKAICESHCNTKFNACLLNFYHDGQDGMAWHSDNEKELGKNPVIASLSFGVNRRFLFRHKKNLFKQKSTLKMAVCL